MAQLRVDMEISVEDAQQAFASIPGRVAHTIQQKGFGNTPAPSYTATDGSIQAYTGYIPPDLTQLTDDQLGQYLGLLSNWLDYVQKQLAEANMNMTTSEEKLKFVEAKLYMIHKVDPETGKKRPENERKMLVLTDRRYVEAQTENIYFETCFRYIKAIADSAEQNYSAVSRRISQRQQDIERGKRDHNTGRIGPIFPAQR